MKLIRGAKAPSPGYRGRGAQSLDRLVGGRFIATLPPWSVKVSFVKCRQFDSGTGLWKAGPSLANEVKLFIH